MSKYTSITTASSDQRIVELINFCNDTTIAKLELYDEHKNRLYYQGINYSGEGKTGEIIVATEHGHPISLPLVHVRTLSVNPRHCIVQFVGNANLSIVKLDILKEVERTSISSFNKPIKEPDSFQKSLLNGTGVLWNLDSDGEVLIDMDRLSKEYFVELLGAGCFTYHLEREGMSVYDSHDLMFRIAVKNINKFIGEDIPHRNNSNMVLMKSLVRGQYVGGLNVLVYPIYKDGVDTGMFKIAWGDA